MSVDKFLPTLLDPKWTALSLSFSYYNFLNYPKINPDDGEYSLTCYSYLLLEFNNFSHILHNFFKIVSFMVS